VPAEDARHGGKPIMLLLTGKRLTVWAKGSHTKYEVSLERLFEFARRTAEQPLLAAMEEQEHHGCCFH